MSDLNEQILATLNRLDERLAALEDKVGGAGDADIS